MLSRLPDDPIGPPVIPEFRHVPKLTPPLCLSPPRRWAGVRLREEGFSYTTDPISAPLTTEDIDRWEKGIAGELKAVQEAGTRMKTARTNEDTLNAMMGVQEMNTYAAGAQAAGMEQERYKFVRSNLSAVTSYLTPSLGGIDTTALSQAQRDELRQANEARIQQMQQDVPTEVVDALRPRAVELRKKDWELVGARLKGAGMQ